jgi:exosortase H (IPTLxxWG-CTERM-specific)
MAGFFIHFSWITVLLFTVQLTPWVQDAMIIPFTSLVARISAAVIGFWDAGAASSGNIIWDIDSGFAVAIEAGCNGVEAGVVLLAAMMAFPALVRQKLIGISIGMLTVQALNLIRIISLFYLGQWNETAFEWAHLYLWQGLIMLDVLLVFLIWVRWVAASRPSMADGPIGQPREAGTK